MPADDPNTAPPAEQLQTLLAGLDRAARDALRLIYFRGLTQRQAAQVLGLPPTVLRRAVAQGMRQLAGRLSAPPPGDPPGQ